jgi:hypothetical protein
MQHAHHIKYIYCTLYLGISNRKTQTTESRQPSAQLQYKIQQSRENVRPSDYPVIISGGILHAKSTHTALLSGGLALHLLADLDVDFEEFGDAAVEADGFALV